MKQGVFWKILVGFWITTLLITQGVWLMFTLLRPPEADSPNTDAFALSASTAILQKEGGDKLRQEISQWPSYWRGQVEVEPSASSSTGAVIGPDGKAYKIIIHSRQHRHGHRPDLFDTPWQVIIVSVLGSLAFSAILARYLTSPVRRIRLGFERLAKGDFRARLGPSMGRRSDEIADLAHDFDTMAARLQELVSHRDKLLAGVSHELRSPLARLQVAIGLAQQDPRQTVASLDRIRKEAMKLDEMVDELLTLSKLESGVQIQDEYLDLAEVVSRVVEDARFEATIKSVEVGLDIEQPPQKDEWIVLGNGKLISRAIENVVRNAIRFSPAGKTVAVALTHTDKDSFKVTVRDEGPGVPASELNGLFKAFVQGGGGDGNGFGLGLAIAERAVRAHHGKIDAKNRDAGGLEVSIILQQAEVAMHG